MKFLHWIWHPAGVALLSWYLIVPGITEQGEIASTEPFSEWDIAVELPTFFKSDCELLRRQVIDLIDPATRRKRAKVTGWQATRDKLKEELGDSGRLDDRQIERRVRAGICVWPSDDFDGFDSFD